MLLENVKLQTHAKLALLNQAPLMAFLFSTLCIQSSHSREAYFLFPPTSPETEMKQRHPNDIQSIDDIMLQNAKEGVHEPGFSRKNVQENLPEVIHTYVQHSEGASDKSVPDFLSGTSYDSELNPRNVQKREASHGVETVQGNPLTREAQLSSQLSPDVEVIPGFMIDTDTRGGPYSYFPSRCKCPRCHVVINDRTCECVQRAGCRTVSTGGTITEFESDSLAFS